MYCTCIMSLIFLAFSLVLTGISTYYLLEYRTIDDVIK